MTPTSALPAPTPDQRRIAVAQFDRAGQVIATGNFDYGIELLTKCCKLDPGNLIYRKTLRKTQRARHKNNLKGGRFAAVTTAPAKLRLKKALHDRDHAKILDICEEIFLHNPWDVGTQLVMARVFSATDNMEAAIWCAELARQRAPEDLKVNKELARLLEKSGQFTQANALWSWIRKHHPNDEEAQDKANALAASETIARGGYEEVIKKQNGTEETAADMPATMSQTPVLQDNRHREEQQLREKIEAEPLNPLHYLQLANWYRRREQWDRVREVLQNGLAAAGNHFQLALELAEAAIQPYRQDLAQTEARLEAQPHDPQLLQLQLQLQTEINRRELELHRQKAERYPTDMSHRLEVGIRLLQAGQLDGAIQELQASRTDPRLHWKAVMYLGFCFKTRNNWRLAQRNFEEALKEIPIGETTRRKEILYQLAQGTAAAGDLPAAIEWACELANEDFAYKNIGQLLDQWQNRLQGA